ncbi:hypothetical protein SUVZ_03G1040 [Saccharomyces uvarum]|uniref:Peptidase S8/S53 domain-containing protein n=1 Tax=Saccharomyces uvarum TaxID=230603 RepID=A0ABN8WRA3_SACUV|nr:hypothetical protein SUVZ_03G1040 [Saccharomyces uvarum]
MKPLCIVISLLANLALAEEYLVRFKNPTAFQQFTSTSNRSWRQFIDHRIEKKFSIGSFRGVTMNLSKNLVNKLKKSPLIADIVPNFKFEAFDTESDAEVNEVNEVNYMFNTTAKYAYEDIDEAQNVTYQADAPRHLARISRHYQLPFDMEDKNRYKSWFNYYYEDEYQGQGVNAYIMDTGIHAGHPEFEDRVIHGVDLTKEGFGDDNGHGTHVAGLVGSKTFGAAKKVSLVEVKVLGKDGSGEASNVLSGLEFIVEHCKKVSRPQGKKCVANLSLGSFRSPIINMAVEGAIEEGIVFVAAAGNFNLDAYWASPASAENVITVGAFDDHIDTIAKFSNWGPCVNIFAPGVEIESLSHLNDNESLVLSGTSMSTPIVTGIAAVLLSKGIEPELIAQEIEYLSTRNVFHRRTLFFKPSTPNQILYNGVDKLDDPYDDETFPRLNVEAIAKELEEYNATLQGAMTEDPHSGSKLWGWNNDVTLPLGEIRLKRRDFIKNL